MVYQDLFEIYLKIYWVFYNVYFDLKICLKFFNFKEKFETINYTIII